MLDHYQRALSMSHIRAVLWDMDGTLIDSEEFHWISWRDAMAKEGIAITHEQFLSSFGQRNDSILPRWLGIKATPECVERIANAKEELYRQLIRQHGISPLPGVTGLEPVSVVPSVVVSVYGLTPPNNFSPRAGRKP